MATEHHDHDERIARAIRDLADDQGRLSSPPATLWGRIEQAIDDPEAGAHPDAGQDGQDPLGGGLVPPPPDLWDRIAAEVRADDGLAPAPAGARRRRYRTIGLAAAAVVAVCAIAAAIVMGRDQGGTQRELIAQAAMSGQGLDPGGDGSGRAELLRSDDGWTVDIQVADLPAPPAGSYYEAWLLGSGADQVQSLGTLDGTDGFAVPEGLAISDFPLVDVSIEPIDGNPAHSSKSVLRGRLEQT